MRVASLSYKHHVTSPYFFKELSFELERGKIHALQGKNGVGKSVLLHALSRNIPEKAVLEGTICGASNVALVNQRYDLLIADQFSFVDNIRFARLGRFPSLFSRPKGKLPAYEMLKTFAIDPTKPVHLLSGGQRQILSLMMVLERPLDILLLDEPTATLDEENAAQVFSFLHTLTLKGITMLIVCHDRDLMEANRTGRHLELVMDDQGLRKLLEAAL